MSTELVVGSSSSFRLPAVPWRDPHTVSPANLARYTRMLEEACEQNPESADMRVCLGMAYAMGFEAYKSMDALETAIALDPDNFWAQLKYAELLYRLRVLQRAREEIRRAMDIAHNSWELSLARKLLQQIRERMREGTQRPEWTKPLAAPALMLALMIAITFLVMWR